MPCVLEDSGDLYLFRQIFLLMGFPHVDIKILPKNPKPKSDSLILRLEH